MSKYRNSLIRLIHSLDKSVLDTIVEVGVHKGATSEAILKAFDRVQLYMIDPWEKWDSDADPTSKADHESCFKEAQRRTEFGRGYRTIIRKTSDEASQIFPDKSADFVFIDARHDFESVFFDFEAWWPKVKPGGILCGHDYGSESPWAKDVDKAVDAFCEKNGLGPVNVMEGNLCWIQK